MAELADFLPDVEPFCEMVPAPIAERAILHACREFCDKSGYWHEDQLFATVTDESGTGEYTLTFAAGTELSSLRNPIHHGNQEVFLKSPEWLSTNFADDWRTKTNEKATYFTMTSKVIVRLVGYPTVAVTNDLRVTKILRPSLTAPTVDNTLAGDWSEAIGWGAIARIKATPNKPYTDLRVVDAYIAAFNDACDRAQSKAIAMWQDRRHQRQRRAAGSYF